jgi:iron(III) transport system substrate-binding protein
MRQTSTIATLAAFALAAMVATPASATMTEHEQQLYEAAKANNESVTWYQGFYRSDTGEVITQAFMEKYPGITANQQRSTSQVAFQRLSQDMRAGVTQADVFTSTDAGHFVFLKGEGVLEQYVPENLTKTFGVFQEAADPDGYYHIIGAGTVTLNYNTQHVSSEDAPKKWTDLLDPKWKDRIGLAHPGYSGYAGSYALIMEKLYGWEFFEELEKNKPQVGRSMVDTVTMLNSGERWVAAGPATSTRSSAARGNPVAVNNPEDGTVMMVIPAAILASSQNQNAARLFIEFLMGVENAQIQADDHGEPIRPEVQLPPGQKSLGEVKTIRVPPDELLEGVPRVLEKWRDLFGL